MARDIAQLIERADPAPTLAWLQEALQSAIELEFFTISPYLFAMWSVKDERHFVARTLREIIYEEMQHMALACNLLLAVGGAPQIKRAAPRYPSAMPGGVKPNLTVWLARLCETSL